MNRSIVASAVLLSFVTAFAGCAGELETLEFDVAASTFDPGKRIAIVGAGPSGLTAARELEKLGYQNVVVFEKNDRIGGKVNTLKLGAATAELGAVFGGWNYDLTFEIANEYGVPYVLYGAARKVYDSTIPGVPFEKSFQDFLVQHYSPAEIGAAIQNYARVMTAYPEIHADSMAGLPRALTKNFGDFAKDEGIVPVAEMAKSLVVGFGYGYYDNVPAIYILKILNMLVKVGPAGLESPPYYVFPTGFQSLWEAVAAGLDVRLNSTVTHIERSEDCNGPLTLVVNGTDTYEFDAVIVSAPLSAVHNFVKLTHKETKLFDKVTSSRYFVTLFAATGLTPGATVFVHDNATSDKLNKVAVWASGGSGRFSAYQLTDRTISAADVVAALATDISTLAGGTFHQALFQKEWTDYFPRVSSKDLKKGFYDEVEDLQGNGGLYYVGGTLSFETVETSARYARSLVRNHFPAAAAVVAP